jgi:hypothetical protein
VPASLIGRLAVVSALLLCLGAAVLGWAPPAQARDGDERVEVRVQGDCGRTSSVRLRLRAEDGRIRVDTQVRTPRTGRWRLTVLHERRIVKRVRVRSTRSGRGFEHRVVVPDYAGADAVSIRAVAPGGGETCTAAAAVAGS